MGPHGCFPTKVSKGLRRPRRERCLVVETFPGIFSFAAEPLKVLFQSSSSSKGSLESVTSFARAASAELSVRVEEGKHERIVLFESGLQSIVNRLEEQQKRNDSDNDVVSQADVDLSQLFPEHQVIQLSKRQSVPSVSLTVDSIIAEAQTATKWIKDNAKSNTGCMIIGASIEHQILLTTTIQMLLSCLDTDSIDKQKYDFIDSMTLVTELLTTRSSGVLSRTKRRLKKLAFTWKAGKSLSARPATNQRITQLNTRLETLGRCLSKQSLREMLDVGLVLCEVGPTVKSNIVGGTGDCVWREMILRKVILTHSPRCDTASGSHFCRPYMMVLSGDGSNVIYSSLVKGVQNEPYSTSDPVSFEINCRLQGDFVIKLYHLPMGQSGKRLLETRFHTSVAEPRESEPIRSKFPKYEQHVLLRRGITSLRTSLSLSEKANVFDSSFEVQLLLGMPKVGRQLAACGPFARAVADASLGPPRSAIVEPLGDQEAPLPVQLRCLRSGCSTIDYYNKFTAIDALVCPSCKIQSEIPVCLAELIKREELSVASCVEASEETDFIDEEVPIVDLKQAERVVDIKEVILQQLPERLELLSNILVGGANGKLEREVKELATTVSSIAEFDAAFNRLVASRLVPESEEKHTETEVGSTLETPYGRGEVVEASRARVVVKLEWGSVVYMPRDSGSTGAQEVSQMELDEKMARELQAQEDMEQETRQAIEVPATQTHSPGDESAAMRSWGLLLDLQSRLDLLSHSVHMQPSQLSLLGLSRRRSGASRMSIESLPSYSYSGGKGEKGYEEGTANKCMVCQYTYKDGEKLRTLPCIHTYHAECVDPWLMQNKVCPVCQRDVDGL